MSNYDIDLFLDREIGVFYSTERDVFKLMLLDCKKGMDVIRETNNSNDDKLRNECDVLEEIIGGY